MEIPNKKWLSSSVEPQPKCGSKAREGEKRKRTKQNAFVFALYVNKLR